MSRTERDILTKAILALLVPALAVGCGLTPQFWVWWRTLLSWPAGRWTLTVLMIVLPLLELYLLVPLWYVIRARGRLEIATSRMLAERAVAGRRRWKRRFGAVGASLLVGFIVLEGVFRLLEIEPEPIPRPRHLTDAAIRDSLNALGVREPWDEIAPSDGRVRVAFLGDSVTYGEGVESEQTFCHRIEELLSPMCPRGVLTINLGEPGTNAARQAERYETLRWSIQPQVLVHVLYPNDLEGVRTHESLMRIHEIRGGASWFGDHSYLFRYVERQVRDRLARRAWIRLMGGGSDAESRRTAWENVEESVAQVKRMVESHHGRYGLALHPWLFELEDYPLMEEHRRMGELAGRLGVPYVDLLEVYAGRDAQGFQVGGGIEYPNEAGHALVADRLLRFLRAELLPECDGRATGSVPGGGG